MVTKGLLDVSSMPKLATSRVIVTPLTPRSVVNYLDRFVIGQAKAKRMLAIAVRRREHRRQMSTVQAEPTTRMNILLSGPSGSGKTELVRRLAKLVGAPLVKCSATSFTEVGYHGADVRSMIEDLVDVAYDLERTRAVDYVKSEATASADTIILDSLITNNHFGDRIAKVRLGKRDTARAVTPRHCRRILARQLADGVLDDEHLALTDEQLEAINNYGRVTSCLTVKIARPLLIEIEMENLIDQDQLCDAAIHAAENGFIFIDEIDKICASSGRNGGDISGEGVQRDLLPLLDGTAVHTMFGDVNTKHILFIVAGAFSACKPSDLLPELQGRLPNRAHLDALTEADLLRILVEPVASEPKLAASLLLTEDVTVSFTDDALCTIAALAASLNVMHENLGARRLIGVLAEVLEDLSFAASDFTGKAVTINRDYVLAHTLSIVPTSLASFIL